MDPLKLHYWFGDEMEVLWHPFWQPIQFMGVGVLGQIETMERSGRQYRKFLSRYPDVLCEPLDCFYVFRKRTAALDALLVEDWLTQFPWREVNEGLWLILLAPQPEYLPLLEKEVGRRHYSEVALDLALASCGGHVKDELRASHERVIRIREMLAELPQSPMPLRPALTPAQRRQWKREEKNVREIYQSKGSVLAMEMSKQGVMGYFNMGHSEWMKCGRPPPPGFVDIEDEIDAESSNAVDAVDVPVLASTPRRKWWRFWQ